MGYEFRLNKNWEFSAGVNIAYTQKNNPQIFDGGNGGVQATNSKFLQNSFYGGVKYYIGRFFINAEFGYQNSYTTINHKYMGTGSNYNYGTTATNGFYQAYGIGYQLPLNKGDNIEFYAKGANGNRNMSYVAGFRYNFGLFKRK